MRRNIRRTAHVREVVDDLMSILQRKASLLLQTSRSVDSDWEGFSVVLSLREILNVLKVAKGPGEEL